MLAKLCRSIHFPIPKAVKIKGNARNSERGPPRSLFSYPPPQDAIDLARFPAPHPRSPIPEKEASLPGPHVAPVGIRRVVTVPPRVMIRGIFRKPSFARKLEARCVRPAAARLPRRTLVGPENMYGVCTLVGRQNQLDVTDQRRWVVVTGHFGRRLTVFVYSMKEGQALGGEVDKIGFEFIPYRFVILVSVRPE